MSSQEIIPPAEEAEVVSEITGTWQAVTKDAEGVAHVHTLHKHSVQTRPAEEPVDVAAQLIRQAPPSIVRPSRRAKPKRADRLTLAFGDAQIPFHDPRAVEMAQIAVTETRPDNIVFVGDMIDLPSMSRFDQRSEWQGKTQEAIDTYHSVLAQTRANAPNARIVVVHGNHEQRLDNYVRRNAAEVLGLKRANMQDELGVLTLQYLARYDDLGIESVDGYPNGTLWLEDNLKFTHGTNTQKGGSNAAKYLRGERESTVYGHSHRMEVAYRTLGCPHGRRSGGSSQPWRTLSDRRSRPRRLPHRRQPRRARQAGTGLAAGDAGHQP
jgi:predicted phosphodiesterase